MVQNTNFSLNAIRILVGSIPSNQKFAHVTIVRWYRQFLDHWFFQTYSCGYLSGFGPPTIGLWGLFFFMACHDVLLWFLLKEMSVCAILVAALRTLDTDLRMFMAFAYFGYGFCARRSFFTFAGYRFCARCATFAYVYWFGLHVVVLDRAILSRWSNITVHYALW